MKPPLDHVPVTKPDTSRIWLSILWAGFLLIAAGLAVSIWSAG